MALVTLIAITDLAVATARAEETPEGQLEKIENALKEREAREKGLDGEVSDASGQVEKIRRELIDAAAVVQDQETQLDETEREIADLDKRYAERQAAFEKHRGELERTLSALALFARSPPQALIARPGDWGDTVRGLKLLDNAIPALKESADAAAAEAAALAALRDARTARQAELADTSAALDTMHADLRRLLERKSSLHASLIAERRRLNYEITALGAEATDTRDLIDRLEMARVEATARQADEAAALAAQPAEPSGSKSSSSGDDPAVGVPPPPLEAPVEPAAATPATVPSPDVADPDLAAPDINTETSTRLANATAPLSETPVESDSGAPAVAVDAQPVEPSLSTGSLREDDLVVAAAPPQLEAPAEPAAAVPEVTPSPGLADPDLAAPDSDASASPRLANSTPSLSETPSESDVGEPAEAPSAKLAEQEPTAVAPDSDASTRLAALPVSPPRPPIKSSLPYPAHGDVIAQFGASRGGGQKSLGASIRTRERGQVVAPRRGEVVFAGPFRGYGQLLILEHDGGYHSLLSGFSRIDAQVGQRVLAGEPVGVMGMVAESGTILYIEIRQNRQPIDPIPWLMAGDRKVSG